MEGITSSLARRTQSQAGASRKWCPVKRATSMLQLDLFESSSPPSSLPSSSPIVGMKMQLPRPCPNCGGNIGVVGSSGGPHANRVTCESCSVFRRWLGQREADFIAKIVSTFGCPTTPIVVRDWPPQHT